MKETGLFKQRQNNTVIHKALQKLSKKHLLIIGGEAKQRENLIDELINQANLECFRFPIGMKSIEEYVEFVRKKKLFQPWYAKKGKFGINQVLDFHRDWIAENNSLVVMEELQELEENWKMDLIKTYVEQIQHRQKGEKTIRLIISQGREYGLIDNLAQEIYTTAGDRRTAAQIVSGSIEVIEME